MLHRESYKGLAPPRKTTEQRTPTVNPNYRRSAQFTDQALGTIENAAHESSRITPTSTPNSGLHCTNPAGTLLESSQPLQLSSRRRRAQLHNYTDTTRNSGDTWRHTAPPSRGSVIMNWWSAMDARPESAGDVEAGGKGGGVNEGGGGEGVREMSEQVAGQGCGGG